MSGPHPLNPVGQPAVLQRYLQRSRDAVVAAVEGVGEHDARRSLTPTGTNLLGLVKHLAGVELGYLGDCVGRPSGIVLPFEEDGSIDENGDLWMRPDETREWVLDLYRAAWAHSDATLRELPLDAPATVPWWGERGATTLGHLAVHVLLDSAQHAGHAEVLREGLDGSTGTPRDAMGDDDWWTAYVARVDDAAAPYRGR